MRAYIPAVQCACTSVRGDEHSSGRVWSLMSSSLVAACQLSYDAITNMFSSGITIIFEKKNHSYIAETAKIKAPWLIRSCFCHSVFK